MSRCKTLELNRLAKSIKGSKWTSLSVFFSDKTHKGGIPFRCIVSEKGSWQRELSRYLQKPLNTLKINDPFAVRNSQEVIDFVQKNGDVGGLFYVDIEDLFFSIPHGEILASVQECIEKNGATTFQNAAGISVSGFLSLLE